MLRAYRYAEPSDGAGIHQNPALVTAAAPIGTATTWVLIGVLVLENIESAILPTLGLQNWDGDI